jgi:hypothetical protein
MEQMGYDEKYWDRVNDELNLKSTVRIPMISKLLSADIFRTRLSY